MANTGFMSGEPTCRRRRRRDLFAFRGARAEQSCVIAAHRHAGVAFSAIGITEERALRAAEGFVLRARDLGMEEGRMIGARRPCRQPIRRRRVSGIGCPFFEIGTEAGLIAVWIESEVSRTTHQKMKLAQQKDWLAELPAASIHVFADSAE